MRRSRAGFTLLEVLAATFLTAILAGAVLTILDTARRARTQLEERSSRRLLAAGVLESLVRDLSGALATGTAQDPGFLGNDDSAGDLEIDRIQFLTMSGRPDRIGSQPESDFRQIRYYVETDPEAEEPGLVREELALMTGTSLFGEDLFAKESLAEEVAELDFEYFDGSSWQVEWDSNVNQGMPKAVRVEIAFADSESRFGRSVPLRIERDFQGE